MRPGQSCEAEQEGGNNGLQSQQGCWLPEPGWASWGLAGVWLLKIVGEVPAQEANKINIA